MSDTIVMNTSRLSVFVSVILLSACSTKYTEINENLEKPRKSNPISTKSIGCFADMLATYRRTPTGIRPLRVAVTELKDATAISTDVYPNSEIPVNFTDFGITALSKIGHPVQVIHIPRDSELNKAHRFKVANNTSFFGAYQPRHYQGSAIQLVGALTEYDRLETRKRQRVDTSVDFTTDGKKGIFDSAFQKERNQARMTMDLHVVRGALGDVISRANSNNTLHLYQQGNDFQLGFGFQGDTVGYSHSASRVDARHLAMRLLVERNVIESLGKYAYVPYWKCLDDHQTDGVSSKRTPPSTYSMPMQAQLRSTHRLTCSYPNAVCETQHLPNSHISNFLDQVRFHYEQAEYMYNQQRRIIKRPDVDTPLNQLIPNLSEKENKLLSTVTIKGKASMMNNLLATYKPYLAAQQSHISDAASIRTILLDKRRSRSQLSNHASDSDDYLWLWLNAPIQKNSRWK